MEDIRKLGVAFSTAPGAEPLVAIFPTTTETIANLANQRTHSPLEPEVHQLDDNAEDVSLPEVEKRLAMSSSPNSTPVLVARDPSLQKMHDPPSYIDVSVDDF